jgi:hypothetical protein
MKRIIITTLIAAGILPGCAGSVSSVVSTGANSYMVAAEGVLGNSSSGMQLFKAQEEASSYCKKQGKQVETISSNEVAGGFGKVASATVNFRCIAIPK